MTDWTTFEGELPGDLGKVVKGRGTVGAVSWDRVGTEPVVGASSAASAWVNALGLPSDPLFGELVKETSVYGAGAEFVRHGYASAIERVTPAGVRHALQDGPVVVAPVNMGAVALSGLDEDGNVLWAGGEMAAAELEALLAEVDGAEAYRLVA